MFTLSGLNAQSSHALYTLYDSTGNLIYIGHSRIANLLSLQNVLKNPAFDVHQNYTVQIVQIYNTQREAQNAVYNYLCKYSWPALNKTNHVNHYTKVRCIETGQEFRNASECAKAMDVNPAQLSQHLRKMPGYKKVKGFTFEHFGHMTNEQAAPQRVEYNRSACNI